MPSTWDDMMELLMPWDLLLFVVQGLLLLNLAAVDEGAEKRGRRRS